MEAEEEENATKEIPIGKAAGPGSYSWGSTWELPVMGYGQGQMLHWLLLWSCGGCRRGFHTWWPSLRSCHCWCLSFGTNAGLGSLSCTLPVRTCD